MFTGRAVLLTTRKLCVRVGPRGTEPKSLDSSSNSESAQVAAAAGDAVKQLPRKIRLYRNMLTIICCSDPPAHPGATRRDGRTGRLGATVSIPPLSAPVKARSHQ